MKALKLALTGLLMLCALSPAQANALIIKKDYGGIVVDFVKKYSDIRDRNEKVIVDGECDSSCTLFLGIVPKQNYCVTPNAKLGFHTASLRTARVNGTFVFTHAAEFSALMWNIYPGRVRSYLKKVGWNGDDYDIAHPDIVYVEDEALNELGIRPCGPGDLR